MPLLQTGMDNLQEKLIQLQAGASAVGLDHHRRELAAYRQRVKDSHDYAVRAAGHEPSEGEDMGGDFILTGDIQQTAPQQKNHLPIILAAILGTTLPLSSAVGYWMANFNGTDAEPPIVSKDLSNTLRPDFAP